MAIGPEDFDHLVALAQVLTMTGHASEAVRLIEQAHRLEPSGPDWHRQVAGLAYLLTLTGKPGQGG